MAIEIELDNTTENRIRKIKSKFEILHLLSTFDRKKIKKLYILYHWRDIVEKCIK